MNSIFVILFGALLNLCLPVGCFPIDLREVRQIMAVVDPMTCGCKEAGVCQVLIPRAEMFGFRCSDTNTRFCCDRRPPIRRKPGEKYNPQPYSLPKNIEALKAQIPDSVKEALAQSPYKDLLVGKDEQQKVIIKTPESAVITPSPTTTAAPTTHHAEAQVCQCVKSGQCPSEHLDLTFGTSCGFGLERCCGENVVELIKNHEEAAAPEYVEKLATGPGNNLHDMFQEKIDDQHELHSGPVANIPDPLVPQSPEVDTPTTEGFTRHTGPQESIRNGLEEVEAPQNIVPKSPSSEEQQEMHVQNMAYQRYVDALRRKRYEADNSIAGQINRFINNVSASFRSFFSGRF